MTSPSDNTLVARLRARAASENDGGNEAAAERAMMGMEAQSDIWAERVNLNDLIENIVNVGRLKEGTPADVREAFIKRQRELIDAMMRQSFLEGYLEGGLSRKHYDVELDQSVATALEASYAENERLTNLVEQAFRDGLTYGNNVEGADPEIAWEQSRVRALNSKASP